MNPLGDQGRSHLQKKKIPVTLNYSITQSVPEDSTSVTQEFYNQRKCRSSTKAIANDFDLTQLRDFLKR